MKTLSRITLATLLAACCAVTAFAQGSPASCNSSAPTTRAEVRADLVQWRAAGYEPLDWLNYPENAQHAGRIVAQQRAASGNTGACAA